MQTTLQKDSLFPHQDPQNDPEKKRSFHFPKRLVENFWGYFFVLPQMVGFVAFAVVPVVTAFVLMFVDWNMLQPMKFTGLENIREVFSDNHGLLSHALTNTSVFALGIVPLTLVLGLLIAVLLKRPSKLGNFYKTSLFLPFVTASAAISLVWYWMLAPGVGLVNTILSAVGIVGPDWLRDPLWARIAIIAYIVWQNLGYAYLIYGAGLENIPESYYEAARIDGATVWNEFRYITLPLLSPTTFFLMITLVIGSFNLFGEVYIITGGTGGPLLSTYTLVMYIYQLAFSFFHMGQSAVVSWILFLILFVLTWLNFRFSKRWVYYIEE